MVLLWSRYDRSERHREIRCLERIVSIPYRFEGVVIISLQHTVMRLREEVLMGSVVIPLCKGIDRCHIEISEVAIRIPECSEFPSDMCPLCELGCRSVTREGRIDEDMRWVDLISDTDLPFPDTHIAEILRIRLRDVVALEECG